MAYTICARRGTVAAFSALNRVYEEGELLLEEQGDGSYKLKAGDGSTAYNSLPYVFAAGAGSNSFSTIAVPAQTSVVAESTSDTLTLTGLNGIAITTDAPNDNIGIAPTYGTTAATVCQGNDSRLTNARTPTGHATAHAAGGSDALKLDALATPDDSVTLDASAARHGLLRKLSGDSSQYLTGLGTWATPSASGGIGVDVRGFAGWGGSAGQNSDAINTAITTVAALGGGDVFLPGGAYDISGMININSSRVRLRGRGANHLHDAIGQQWGTKLTWVGDAAGTMITVAPISSTSNRNIEGCGVHDLFLDGNNSAVCGLAILSARAGRYSGIMFTKFVGAGNAAALIMGVVAVLASGDARDTQYNTLDNMVFRLFDSEGTASGVLLTGDSVANTSKNIFNHFIIQHGTGHGFIFGNSDNNLVNNLGCWRPTGTGVGVIFVAASADVLTGRANRITGLYSQAGVYAQGTTIAAYPSKDNHIIHYDKGNGSPDPVIDTAATLSWASEQI